MPRRELSHGRQVVEWLQELGGRLRNPGEMVLIGSGALLWHAARRGIDAELPARSMDVDPITDGDEIAEACYDCLIGSEFEKTHGWHVNLMPGEILQELPEGWRGRAESATYGKLSVVVPSPGDLLAPKLKRGEPRDREHAAWARAIGLVTDPLEETP